MANIGDKYIIEIRNLGVGNDTYYLKNSVLNHSVVSGRALQGFEKYDPEADYQRGLDDTWKALRAIADKDMTCETLDVVFGEHMITRIAMKYTAAEVIEKLAAYEAKKKAEEEIRVGDEVKDCEAEKGIVFDRKDNKYLVVYFDLAESDIYSGELERGELKKTGRHFPQVAELLDATEEEGD